MKTIAIIGGGAAGFFAAISAKTHHPEAEVTLYEKSDKLLSKVRISGGGRCNVTNDGRGLKEFSVNYPRGEKQLKKAFAIFKNSDTIQWFESRGAKLKAEEDGRVFPVSDSSHTIVDCLLREAKLLGIKIKLHSPILSLKKMEEHFELECVGGIMKADNIIIASGGHPKAEGFEWLNELGHRIVKPVPSLFTFNIPGDEITTLMGVSVENVTVRIQGTKLSESGPLLITHWGMSGPSVLKLSSWGARILSEKNYEFSIHVNWTGKQSEQDLRVWIKENFEDFKRKKTGNTKFAEIPSRLWIFLLKKSAIDSEGDWMNLKRDQWNKLINTLCNDEYRVEGKTTFKEEFVTCGGVDLDDIDFRSMESKVCRGLYFAGEVLDIDGITGGFNFQAAWTTGYIAGKLG